MSGKSDRDRRQPIAILLILLLVSGTLFFFRLGSPGLFDADEPAYAQAAREMLESGDWITPHFNGRPRFDKPILFYWLISLSYRVFGVTEFAVRFWSALAGVALVLLIAWTARRRFGPPADLWAGLALTTNLLTALLARAAVTDMLLTLFVTLAILAGLEAQEGSRRAGWWARLGWAAMAFAVLVKGPVGLLVPGLALGGSLLFTPERRSALARLIPWDGPVLFAALTLPWYGLVLAANGWSFVEGFLIKHHITRYTGIVSSHAGPIWYYFPVLLIGFFPWSGFLPAALWRVGRMARRRQAADPGERLLVASACWLLGVFVFFSFAGTKLPSYLFPAFPGLALLVGATSISNFKPTTDNGSTGENGRLSVVGCQFSIAAAPVPRWVSRLGLWFIGLTGGALAVGLAAIPLILDRLRPLARGVLDGVAPPIALAWGLASLLALGTAIGLLAKGTWRPAVLAAMMTLVIFTAGVLGAPQAYAILQGPLREFAEVAQRLLGPRGTLVAYGLNAPSVVFYAARPVMPLGAGAGPGLEQIRGLVKADIPVVVITRAMHAPNLDGVPGLFRLKTRGGYAIYCSACQAEANFKFQTDN
jgi:4-amino-4-deoxy-L-arabinose transferase-like glycosyltransferase